MIKGPEESNKLIYAETKSVMFVAEVESSRTSLRTHFQVLGLGLEASSHRKLSCLCSRTALFFEWSKFCRSAEKCFSGPFLLEIDRKKIFKTSGSW